jgi:hypothetical protein
MTVAFSGRFRRLLMRIRGSRALAAPLLLVAAAGCARQRPATGPSPVTTLDQALVPATLAAGLRAAGGGHFHATATLRADLAAAAESGESSQPAAPSTVTTTTDLWMDRAGNFRLSESNDQDGGRDVVRVGGEIAVALRYGKLVRRPAQDSESNRFLAEALGAPWAAWEVVRRQVEVDSAGQASFQLKQGQRLVALPPDFPASAGLRKWRDSLAVKGIAGHVTLDAAGKLPLTFTCKASFQALRDASPIAGEVAVAATLAEVGKVADLTMPEADTLHVRQRTVLEERALLGGLGAAAAGSAKSTAP